MFGEHYIFVQLDTCTDTRKSALTGADSEERRLLTELEAEFIKLLGGVPGANALSDFHCQWSSDMANADLNLTHSRPSSLKRAALSTLTVGMTDGVSKLKA